MKRESVTKAVHKDEETKITHLAQLCQWYDGMVQTSCLFRGHGHLSRPYPLGIFNTFNTLLRAFACPCQNKYTLDKNCMFASYFVAHFYLLQLNMLTMDPQISRECVAEADKQTKLIFSRFA